MTAAAAAAWPGSRILLGWWRELAAHRPRRLWVAHLLLHRLEALVGQSRRQPLDALQHALLHLLPQRRAADLPGFLHLDSQIVTRLLHGLVQDGLLQVEAGSLHLTAHGQQAREEGSRVAQAEDRRTFYFLDCSARQQPPRFLPLQQLSAALPAGAPARPIDISALQACIDRDAAWKSRHHFPPEVEAVLSLTAGSADAGDWRRVVLDSVEEVWLALMLTERGDGGPAVLGFAVQPTGWGLQGDRAVLRLGPEWAEVLPELAEEPGEDSWRQAWQGWCQPRSIPAAEAASCRLEPSGHQLVVHAPRRLIDRLRAARSDAVKQEAWLLAGSEPFRPAALIHLVENTAG